MYSVGQYQGAKELVSVITRAVFLCFFLILFYTIFVLSFPFIFALVDVWCLCAFVPGYTQLKSASSLMEGSVLPSNMMDSLSSPVLIAHGRKYVSSTVAFTIRGLGLGDRPTSAGRLFFKS